MARRRARSRGFVVGALLVGLLAGCVSDPQSATDPPGTPRPSGLPPSGHPFRTVASAPFGMVSRPLDTTAVSRPATTTRIRLSIDVSACTPPGYAVTLTTTATAITIGYWTRPPLTNVICANPATEMVGYVQLDAPIGRRTIEHVPVGTRAPRR